MINLILGRPGGGKSYEAVAYHILPSLKDGRKVVTNLPLNVEHFVKVLGEPVRDLIVVIDTKLDDFGNVNRPFSQAEHYQDEWRNDKGQGVLVVVDEAHLVLPTGRADVKVLEFLSLHRHYGIDVLLITQSDRKLHKDVRDMVQLVYRCSKNTALGSDKTYTQKVIDGCRGELINTNQRKYKSAYFHFYQSHTASKSSVDEATASDVRPIWMHWSFIGSLVCLVVVIYMVASGKLTNPLAVKTAVVDEVIEVPVLDINSSGVSVVTQPEFTESTLFDFSLFVSGSSRQIVLEEDGFFNTELSFDRVYISAYKGDLKYFDFKSDDLWSLGYKFSRVSDCLYVLEYESTKRFVTCNDSLDVNTQDALPDTISI